MRTIYGIQFQVKPRPDQTPSECIGELRQLAAAWVTKKYRRVWNVEVMPPFDGNRLGPLSNHWVTSNHECYNDCELVSLEWGHPDDKDDSVAWITTCMFARDAEAIYAAVSVALTSARFVVRPTRYVLGRPGIVWETLTHCECIVGGQRVPVTHQVVTQTGLDEFVHGTLLAKERALPVILISPDAWTERPVAQPDVLQKAVAGFAQVAVLSDKRVAFRLTDKLGKELTCFDGAVRVYWPGFTLMDYPFMHPLYLGRSIRFHRLHGRELKTHLFRVLAGMSAFRVGELGPILGIRRNVKAHQDAQVAKLRYQVTSGTAENSELLAELEKALAANEALIKERDDLAERNELLGEELKVQKANWATFEQSRDQTSTEQDIAPDSSAGTVEFENTYAAYQKAKTDFTGPLVFLDSAGKSARKSPFKNARQVYATFETLCLVAMEWQENKGKLGRSFKDALKAQGVDVHQVSQTSKGKYSEEYKFTYNDQHLFFGEHTTLGAGQPDTCLSIHWHRDEKNYVVAIGHCGRHLANTKA